MDLTQPEYAYMFGFLQADGHLSAASRNRGRLALEVSSIDRELLVKFQELCPYPSSVRDRTRTTNFKADHTSSMWSMHSLEGRTIISSLGLPYGKKSTLITPPTVDFSARDYLRGLVDADGSVGFTGPGKPFIGLSTSSEAIARFFADFCMTLTAAVRNPGRNRRDNIFNIAYFDRTAVKLTKELYYDGALALGRKARSASAVAKWEPPPPRSTLHGAGHGNRWTPEEDQIALRERPARAAELLGRSPASCTTRRSQLRKRLAG
ncbi:LAGLIDADG family homing endonuclease [Yinghuangia aomiensis]